MISEKTCKCGKTFDVAIEIRNGKKYAYYVCHHCGEKDLIFIKPQAVKPAKENYCVRMQ